MKVFISWSGECSRKIATVLHDWLPSVLQTVNPYMSSENIDKGERWSVDISSQLQETNYGIICVTPENLEAPWILFESGALSKSMQKSRVSPIMFGLEPSDFTKSPLLQFQLTSFSKDDIGKLLTSINNSAQENEKVSDAVLRRSFDRAWVELQDAVSSIEIPKKEGSSTQIDTNSINSLDNAIQEILTNSRTQVKLLNSPSDILPKNYLRVILREMGIDRANIPRSHPVWRDIEAGLELIDVLSESRSEDKTVTLSNKSVSRLLELGRAMRYIVDKLLEGRSPYRGDLPIRRLSAESEKSPE